MRKVILVYLALTVSVFAQSPLGGEGPIDIQADSLEVRDEEQKAIFKGNVVVTQSGTTLTTPKLTVFYKSSSQGDRLAELGTGGEDIDRLEAEGRVKVSQKNQVAEGDFGIFEGESEIITLSGNVILVEGENVIKGDKLIVNLRTKESRVLSEKKRVRALIVPKKQDTAGNPKP